jgi:hypothetical protein
MILGASLNTRFSVFFRVDFRNPCHGFHCDAMVRA